MAQVHIPFVDKQNNRSYLNDKDYLMLNAFIEKSNDGASVVKRPGWKFKKVVSSIVTTGRGFTYSSQHNLYYAVIGDGLFSISADLQTVTEIVRKTPIAVSCAAGTATYTFAAAHGFLAGQQVKASGILPVGYAGILTILAVTTVSIANDSFTVTMTCPGASTLTNARVSPILSETGKVYFEQTKSSTVMNVMLQVPKTSTTNSQLFMIASGGVVTRVTAANWPTDTIGPVASVDGYLFGLSSARNEIYNMDLEAPTTITSSLAFVKADTYADSAVALAKHHNQVVCFKEYSTEFFYDATIAAPVSPITKIPQQTLTIGCASAASIVQSGNQIIWVSRNQNGGLGIHIMNGGQSQKISSPFIDRIIASMESFIYGEKVESLYISYEGHEFYILSIEGSVGTNQAIVDYAVVDIAVVDIGGSLNTYKRTLVYDMTEQQWHEWSSYDTTIAAQSIFFGAYSVSGPHVSSSQDFTNTLIMEKSTGDIYEMSPAPIGASYGATYKDGIRTITVKAVTNNIDGGTRNRKRMNSLEVLGDRNTTSTILSIRYSDDDYKTWSSARSLDLSDRAWSSNWGTFRIRAFEFTHADDTPLRLNSIELDVAQLAR